MSLSGYGIGSNTGLINRKVFSFLSSERVYERLEKTPGVGDGQGGLPCCDSWGRKESDTTERLN